MIEPLDLRLVRAFLAVAAEGSFTRAAARLGYTQQAVSAQVARLEAAVGVALLQRTPRGVVLTPQGQARAREAQPGLEAVQRGLAAARDDALHARLAYTRTVVYALLPQVVATLAAAAPALTLEAEERLAVEADAGVADGTYAAALIRDPDPLDGALSSRPLGTERLAAILPRGHRLATAPSLDLAALATEAFMLAPRWVSPGYHDVLTGACERAGFTPRLAHNPAPGTEVLAELGHAVGLSVVSYATHAPRTVAIVPIDDAAAVSTVHLVWRTRATDPATAVIRRALA
jgi:DNA-binding transcriptional LysR family regulator